MLNDLYQILDPVAFSIGPFAIRWYGLAYVAGFLLAGLIIYRTAKRWKVNLDLDTLSTVVIVIIVGILFGGRLGYCIFYGDGEYLKDPIEVLRIQNGGMSFHGALFFGALLGVIVCRKIGMPALTFADLACVGIPVGLFFGRIANFINGELWGSPTDLPWGVVFGGYAGTVPRHPSQLYEAFLEGIVIFVVLFALSRKIPPLRQGTFSGLFLVLYGVFRILVEFVREPDAQVGYLFGDWLTMGMVLSVPLLFIGAGLLIYAKVVGRVQEGVEYIEDEDLDAQKKNRKLAPNETEYVLNDEGEYVLNEESEYIPSFHGFEKIPRRNKYGNVGTVYELELDPELFGGEEDEVDELDDYQEYAPFNELEEYQLNQSIEELDEPEDVLAYEYRSIHETTKAGVDVPPSSVDVPQSEFEEDDWRGDRFGQVKEIKPHSFAGAVKKVSDAIMSTYERPPFSIIPTTTSTETAPELEPRVNQEPEDTSALSTNRMPEVEGVRKESEPKTPHVSGNVTPSSTIPMQAYVEQATEIEPKALKEAESTESQEPKVEPKALKQAESTESQDSKVESKVVQEPESSKGQMPEVVAEAKVKPEKKELTEKKANEIQVDESEKTIKKRTAFEVSDERKKKPSVKKFIKMDNFPEPTDTFKRKPIMATEDIPAPADVVNDVDIKKTDDKLSAEMQAVEGSVTEKKDVSSDFDLKAELERLRKASRENSSKEETAQEANKQDKEEFRVELKRASTQEPKEPPAKEIKEEKPIRAADENKAEEPNKVELRAEQKEKEPNPSLMPNSKLEPDGTVDLRSNIVKETNNEAKKEEKKSVESVGKVNDETKEEVRPKVSEEVDCKDKIKEEKIAETKKEVKEEDGEKKPTSEEKSTEEAEQTIDDILSLKLFGRNSDKSRANTTDILAQKVVKNEKNGEAEKKSYVKNRIRKGKFFKR